MFGGSLFFGLLLSSSLFGDRLCEEILTDAERALRPKKVLELGAGVAQTAKQIQSSRTRFDPQLLTVVGPRDTVESLDMVSHPGTDYVGTFEEIEGAGKLGLYDTIFISNPFGIDLRDPQQLANIGKHLASGGRIVMVGSPLNRFMGLKVNGDRVWIRENFRNQAASAGFDMSLAELEQALPGQAGSHETNSRFVITLVLKTPTEILIRQPGTTPVLESVP